MIVPGVRPPLAGVGDEPCPEHRRDHLAHQRHAFGPQQLAERTLGPGGCSGTAQVGGPPVDEALDAMVAVHPHQLLADDRVVGRRRCACAVPSSCCHDPPTRPDPCRLGVVTFEAEGGQRDLPALADLTEPHRVGDADVGEEHLVERRAAAHLLDRAHLDARQVERDRGTPSCPDASGRRGRAGRSARPTRRTARPSVHTFWPLITHLVAVAYGATAQRREVGAGAGLGEQLAAQLAGGEEVANELPLLLGGPEHLDRRGDQPGGDAVRLVARSGVSYSRLDPGEGPGVLALQAEPAVLRRRR